MNEDVLKGKWKEIKGGVKEKWGKLTDDDLTQVEGNKEKLLGLLQQNMDMPRTKPSRNTRISSAATRGSNVLPLTITSVSYTHLRAHETKANLVCRLLLEKKKHKKTDKNQHYTFCK